MKCNILCRVADVLLPAAVLLLVSDIPIQAQQKADKSDQSPNVQYSIPFTISTGVKSRIILRGKNLDTAKSATCDAKEVKLKFLAARKSPPANNYPVDRLGDSEIELEIEIPKGALADEVAIRVEKSPPFPLTLMGSALAEKEPNDGFAQAQEIKAPAIITGTIGRERDVDVYRITGQPGEKLRIELEAAKKGSPLDGRLMLHDSSGRILEASDDQADSRDPVLETTLPGEGVVLISLIDANDLGGPQFGYRLRVQIRK